MHIMCVSDATLAWGNGIIIVILVLRELELSSSNSQRILGILKGNHGLGLLTRYVGLPLFLRLQITGISPCSENSNISNSGQRWASELGA